MSPSPNLLYPLIQRCHDHESWKNVTGTDSEQKYSHASDFPYTVCGQKYCHM
jgi:hypothetical protein